MKRVESLFCGRCKKKEVFPLNSPIYVNDPVSNAPAGFPSNEIRTTKYTILSFVPKNLLEQFRRYQNFYFLFVCIPTLIPSVSPISPASAILPFIAILLVAAIKEGWEDWKRWKQDSEYNSRKYEVYRDSLWVNIYNRDIQTGDLICLKDNEEVPADVVLISSSHAEGVCYFETANLDGETYLKQSVAHPELQSFTKDKLTQINAVLNVAAPDKALYSFKGTMTMTKERMLMQNPLDDRPSSENGTVYPLGGKQLLMRGVRIRNTKVVMGIVVYTGRNTKLALNQVSTPSKFSRTERFTNWVTVLIFFLQMALVIACTIAAAVEHGRTNYTYLHAGDADSTPADAGKVFASYFVLLAYFIPISLFVNLEVIKVAQAYFISVDEQMTTDGKGATVQNSNLNDELSRVSYIFSDKTGTLTQNKMIFDSCSINGVNYKDAGKGELKSKLKDKEILDFFLNLALNNEALVEDNGEKVPHFAAPSPDDIALVKGSYINGVKLVDRDTKSISLQINNKAVEVYQILYILPFSSQRKRSSVIVRTPGGKIMMYTKGADSVMFKRLDKSCINGPIVKSTKKHLTDYSVRGLRTLVIGRKEVSKQQLDAFTAAYNKANGTDSMNNREALVDQCMDSIEQDLFIQGCTAIEDKLQENVSWAIDYFIKAGIRVWMITGDKQETAENIGKSCKLISEESTLVRIVEAKDSNECGEMIQTAKKVLKTESNVSLIIDSASLIFVLVEYRDDLLEIGEQCSSVIVCRAEPLQKAQVVSLVKKGTKKICLAIGDGANDVSMIQEAHIGVGIWGEEGTQAARNADYSIRQFKHLARLVTVHGRYNMLRTALLVEYSFYKNLAMFLVQFWFAPFCLWSSQTFYDDWVMAGFNTVLLSAPPLALAFFEKDLEEDVIFRYPEVYRELRDGLYFTPQSFARWIGSALWHSLVFFFLHVITVPDAMDGSGLTADLLSSSTLVASAAIVTIILRAALVTKYWVWISHVAYWGSVLLMIILFLIESASLTQFPSFFGVMPFVMGTPWFWLYIPCTVLLCLLPDMVFEICQRDFRPWNYQIIREVAITRGYSPLQLSGYNGPSNTSAGFIDVKLTMESEPGSGGENLLSAQEPLRRDSFAVELSDSDTDSSNNEELDGSDSSLVDLT
eukprot:TRINITY_DN15324_c0_g1_i1.p1 TRINITY_DN15324_c0_g1~~TRINITY_DN15324_c0_g1_i1.p1  ORF type:complete len:1142 (-),score=178.20 TRINITY_DN15324_c0_g1_i1:43-3468(-)